MKQRTLFRRIDYKSSPGFMEIKEIMPPRFGGHKLPEAFQLYHEALKAGIPHEEIRDGVLQYSMVIREAIEQGKMEENSPFIQQLATFLRNQQWLEDWVCERPCDKVQTAVSQALAGCGNGDSRNVIEGTQAVSERKGWH